MDGTEALDRAGAASNNAADTVENDRNMVTDVYF